MDELIHSNFIIKKIFALKDWIEQNKNIDNIIEVSEQDLLKISKLKTPNKVVAIVEKKIVDVLPDLKNKITLMLGWYSGSRKSWNNHTHSRLVWY